VTIERLDRPAEPLDRPIAAVAAATAMGIQGVRHDDLASMRMIASLQP
jgi:hypothetical protein